MSLPTVNTQPIEKRVAEDNCRKGELEVHSIFPTIQGEGPFAGRPAVFVRLAGCNLHCPACDTDYTSTRRIMTPEFLVKEIQDVRHAFPMKADLIILTGGEPLRQACGKFLVEAFKYGYHVQIETNGTLDDPSLAEPMQPGRGSTGMQVPMPIITSGRLMLVCSPKTPKINERIEPHVNCFKYILQAEQVDFEDGLPLSSLNCGVRPARPGVRVPASRIYVQPCDEGNVNLNRLNTQAAIKSCMQFGYTLCIQLHKIVGLP